MRSIAFILLAVSVVVGCGQLLPSSLLAAKSAENALQRAALEWTRAPSGVPFEGARACTIWPIQDALTVSATTDKICVKGQVHRLLPPSVTPPAVDTVVVHSDGGGTSEQLDGRAGAISSAAPKKLGECTDHGAAKSIWAHPFEGCIDNQGHGRQAVGFVDIDVLGYRARALAIRQWGEACVRAVCGSCEIGPRVRGGPSRARFGAPRLESRSSQGLPGPSRRWETRSSAPFGMPNGARSSFGGFTAVSGLRRCVHCRIGNVGCSDLV